jgi:hypothetical protein
MPLCYWGIYLYKHLCSSSAYQFTSHLYLYYNQTMTANYNDRLLEQIRRQLWSIAALSPEMVEGSMMRLLGTGCEE